MGDVFHGPNKMCIRDRYMPLPNSGRLVGWLPNSSSLWLLKMISGSLLKFMTYHMVARGAIMQI